jgi:putative membrane protein
MGIVRTIIWVLLTVILVVFAMANWSPVTVTIWPGEVLDTKLPMLILAAFLIGSVPMWIALRTARWSMKRRIDTSERQLADLRAMANRTAEPTPVAPMVVTPAPTPAADSSPSPLDAP